ncbi:hypothetical protein PENSPDRAFT_754368 [Peniophora sp. CONT]|nr:hypothetical protein PENSPDRAFT_754368 [Peniophora sp. CONT]
MSPTARRRPFAESQPDDKCGDAMWETYLAAVEDEDKASVESWNGSTTGILTFTGLFAATVAAFVIESYKMLSPDTGAQTVALLAQLVAATNTTPVIPSIDIQSGPFFAPETAIIVNSLWFLSLVLSLNDVIQHLLAKHILTFLAHLVFSRNIFERSNNPGTRLYDSHPLFRNHLSGLRIWLVRLRVDPNNANLGGAEGGLASRLFLTVLERAGFGDWRVPGRQLPDDPYGNITEKALSSLARLVTFPPLDEQVLLTDEELEDLGFIHVRATRAAARSSLDVSAASIVSEPIPSNSRTTRAGERTSRIASLESHQGVVEESSGSRQGLSEIEDDADGLPENGCMPSLGVGAIGENENPSVTNSLRSPESIQHELRTPSRQSGSTSLSTIHPAVMDEDRIPSSPDLERAEEGIHDVRQGDRNGADEGSEVSNADG